uniref:RCC1 and BTB domain-containing protein 2 n=1 Tax=Lygus hesperus TaxID=30085 RepID=A0A0A9YDX6_LYGHE
MSTESVDDAVSLLRGWDILDGCEDLLLSQVRYIHAFSDMGALFVTMDDQVYGVGQNGEHNLLGVEGENYLREVLEEPSRVERLSGQGVIGISVGMWLGAAVTEDGSLYRWGFTSEDSTILLPELVTLYSGTKFTQVTCGAAFFAALTDKNQVYMWGSMNMCTEPTDARLLSLTHTITSLSCGWWHVAMLTDKGQVYTCGYGEDGQLGYPWYEYDDIYSAKKMDIRPVCKQVVCGSISTLCLSTYGEIWACGENDIWQGSLGVDSEEYCIITPKKVRIDATIKEIAATWGSPNIYAALSTEGRIYCWGESRYPALLKNISSLIEACRNERTSFELDKMVFPLESKTTVKPLVLQTSPEPPVITDSQENPCERGEDPCDGDEHDNGDDLDHTLIEGEIPESQNQDLNGEDNQEKTIQQNGSTPPEEDAPDIERDVNENAGDEVEESTDPTSEPATETSEPPPETTSESASETPPE